MALPNKCSEAQTKQFVYIQPIQLLGWIFTFSESNTPNKYQNKQLFYQFLNLSFGNLSNP
jgi:hypothetical protein